MLRCHSRNIFFVFFLVMASFWTGIFLLYLGYELAHFHEILILDGILLFIIIIGILTGIKKDKDVFSPIIILSLSFLVFYWFGSIAIIREDAYYPFHINNPYASLQISLFFACISLIFGILGYVFAPQVLTIQIPGVLGRYLIHRSKNIMSLKSLLAIYILISFISFYLYYFKVIGGLSNYITQYHWRLSRALGHGYLLWGTRFIVFSSVIFLSILFSKNVDKSRKKQLIFLTFIVTICAIMLEILQGNRSRLAILILLYLSIFHNQVKKLSSKNFLIGAFVCFVIIGFGGEIRSQIPRIQDKGLEISIESAYSSLVHSLRAIDRFSLIYEYVPDKLPLQYGRTFVSLLVFPIPRAWWKHKPFGSGPLIANTFNPGMYDPLLKASTSLTTTFMGELYLNFHFPGIILGFYILGVFLRGLQEAKNRFSDFPGIVLLCSFSALWATLHLITGEFVGSGIYYLTWIFPLILAIKVTPFGEKLLTKRHL